MIACTLMDIHPENDRTEASTLTDVKAKRIARFQSTDEGEVLIDPQKGVAVVAEGRVFNASAKSSIASEALQRYMETGVDGLLAMNGQYAMIVYDCRRHKLIALTDTLSTCSLFYEHPDCATNRFSISNTLSHFKKTKERHHLDLEYLVAYLGGRPKPIGRTPFRDVQRLPLATGLTFDSRKLRMKLWQYWWPFPEKTSLPAHICAPRLNEVMTEVTHEYLTHYQGSIGVFLSGGLDSSYVYAVAAHISDTPPIAFHYSFQIPTCDEMEWAEAVVNHYGGELVRMDYGKLWTFQGFPEMPTGEEPVSWLFSTREIIDPVAATHGIRLMLNGVGGDDFFDAPWESLFADMLTWQQPIRSLKRLHNSLKNHEHSCIEIIRRATSRKQTMVPSLPEYISPPCRMYDKPLPHFRGKTHAQRHMEFCLRSARPSVEIPSPYISCSPLFDPRILEIAATLPNHMFRSKEMTKLALRQAARSYLPNWIVDRKKDNPQTSILLQGLQREWPSISHYFQRNTKLYDIGLVDKDKFIAALQSFRAGNTRSGQLIVRAFGCEAWLAT